MPRFCLTVLALIQIFWSAQAIAQPSIFWFNDPVGPDETVLVTGADLAAVTSVTVSRVPDLDSPDTSTLEDTVAIIQANPQSLKFVIPKEFSPGIYRFMLWHPAGAVSAQLNLPVIYWIQGDLGDAVSPGGRIQLFGRNIIRRRDHAQLLFMPERGGPPVPAILNDGGTWRAVFQIPEILTPGLYRVRLSNGDGGKAEQVDAGGIHVRMPDPEPTQTFDIRAYGAIGDGKANNTRAIAAAIAAAHSNGGGIVYLPRGRYLLSETLVIPPGVKIKGERTDLVNLVWPDFPTPPNTLIAGTARFSIEDVTIYASNHRHIISGGFEGNAQAAGAADIAIRRVRIRASAFRGLLDPDATYKRMTELHRLYPNSGPDSVRLSGDRVELSDCDILGTGRSLYLFKASNAVVTGNTLSNGRNGWYSITGSSRVIFENNFITAVDLQGTGGGINTLSNVVGASENIFVGHNVFKGIYGWDREAMTTDGPAGYYFGRAENTEPNRLSLLDPVIKYPASTNWVGAVAMVVNGRGTGQFARVAELEKDAVSSHVFVKLDRPLKISLDSTSVISITQMQQNYLVIDNQFEDSGVAAQSFGTALNHVFAGNRSTRTSGFFAIGLSYGHFQPSWQVQLLDNRIIEGNVYRAGPHREALSEEAAVGVHAYQSEQKPGAPPLTRAIIVRGNQLENDAHIEIKGFSTASPGVRDVVVESNVIGASRVGILADNGVAWWLNRRNVVKQRLTK